MVRVAINGMGRIGRATFKILLDTTDLEVVALNDLVPADNLAYLLGYDSVYGRYGKSVASGEKALVVGGKRYALLAEKDPSRLPWKDLDIDLVFEASGQFTDREKMSSHLKAGAKKVILSTASKSKDVPTIVYGVNQANPSDQLFSCASCTTNCITPVIEIMGRRVGIKKAIMTTIHAYTSSQSIVDGPKKKIRRGRAGAINLVPTDTGAAIATTRVLPQFANRFDGVSVRAPVPSGSIADIILVTERGTSVEEVNGIFRDEAVSERYRGVLGTAEHGFVSSDIIGDARASIVDTEMTQVVDGDLVKIMSWYDNEWGYSSQMVRTAVKLLKG